MTPPGYRARMRVITVPYHLDEYLPGLRLPFGGSGTVRAGPG